MRGKKKKLVTVLESLAKEELSQTGNPRAERQILEGLPVNLEFSERK